MKLNMSQEGSQCRWSSI